MNGFINNIINRHLHTENVITPRLPGRFEQLKGRSRSNNEMNALDSTSAEIDVNNNAGTRKEPDPHKPDENLDRDSSFAPMGQQANNPAPSTGLGTLPSSGAKKWMSEKDTDDSAEHFDADIANHGFNESGIENSYSGNTKALHKKEDNPDTNNNLSFLLRAQRRPMEEEGPVAKNKKTDTSLGSGQQQGYNLPKKNYQQFPGTNDVPDMTPVIKVSIGRVEVRAIVSNQPEKKPGSIAQKPITSLENYLKQRNGEK